MAEKVRRPGILTAVYGASRTGKGKWVINEIEKLPSALVWDYYADFPARDRVDTRIGLVELLKGTSPGILSYSGKVADFNFFCEQAFRYVRKWGNYGSLVIDETSMITGSGKAAGSYGEILRAGLRYGSNLYSMAQSPAESDKTTLRNAFKVHFSSLAELADEKSMHERTRVPEEVISGLKADFDKNEFDCVDVVKKQWYQVSTLKFKRGKATFVPKTEKIFFKK